jgi:hypothetical protein|tara:strand:+ start:7695 stop:7880 length:186 start_codon:yes stop_codon:yes gene_type:complete
MTKCAKCKELIGGSAPAYKASRGFIDIDGIFHDDEGVVIHMECLSHTFNPFQYIENKIKGI